MQTLDVLRGHLDDAVVGHLKPLLTDLISTLEDYENQIKAVVDARFEELKTELGAFIDGKMRELKDEHDRIRETLAGAPAEPHEAYPLNAPLEVEEAGEDPPEQIKTDASDDAAKSDDDQAPKDETDATKTKDETKAGTDAT
jgi:hypothetical protein